MKSYELQPTRDNLINTFKNDAIGRNESLFNFLTLLNEMEQCTSIALEGYWGSGKTFFVKQAQLLIEAFNPFSKMSEEDRQVFNEYLRYGRGHVRSFDSEALINQVPIYYDAWSNDNDNDPILSLVLSILNEYDSEFDFKEVSFSDGSLLKTINSLLSLLPTNVQIPEMIKKEDLLSIIKNNRSIHEKVENLLDDLLVERGERLVVFIDELDRCRPDYAVRFLERIKHYFNNDRITFVFSVNIEQLQHTIKNYYGSGFDATRYLDRFFDYRVSLPKPNMDRFYSMVRFQDDSTWYSEINKAVINTFDFELREISKYLMQVKMVIWKDWNIVLNGMHSPHEGLLFSSIIIIPIIIGLRLHNAEAYHSFISGKNVQPLIDVFNNCGTAKWILRSFINDNEEFESEHNSSTATIEKSIEEVLKEIYDYMLGNRFEIRGESSKRIGKVLIYSTDKTELLKKADLIAVPLQYTNTKDENEK